MLIHPHGFCGWYRPGRDHRWLRLCSAPTHSAAWAELLALTRGYGQMFVLRSDRSASQPRAVRGPAAGPARDLPPRRPFSR